jgi:hypothetical protein
MDLLPLPQKFTACCNGIADMGQVTVKVRLNHVSDTCVWELLCYVPV